MSVGYSSIQVLGYLGQDPDLIQAETGARGTRFSVAVNRVWTDDAGERQEEADWFQVVAWGQLAENCLGYLSKGRLVFVVGRPRMRPWQTQEGESRKQFQVLAQRVIFLDRPQIEDENGEE